MRFASVYKKFDSLDSFIKEIEKIRNDKDKQDRHKNLKI